MPDIKLARLPDRTPVKLAISLTPDLNRTLQEYAVYYQAAYGEAVSVQDLVPAMLQSFLESDRSFLRSRQEPR